jgi:hypothetical protein
VIAELMLISKVEKVTRKPTLKTIKAKTFMNSKKIEKIYVSYTVCQEFFVIT